LNDFGLNGNRKLAMGKKIKALGIRKSSAADFPHTVRDIQRLVTEALTTGVGKMTFARDLRVHLTMHPTNTWLIVLVPMPIDDANDIGPKAHGDIDWDVKISTAVTLVEKCIQHCCIDKEYCFRSGHFGPRWEEQNERTRAYVAKWEQR
jgi:hypothetical protein